MNSKKLFTLLFAVVSLISVSFTSCSKDEEPQGAKKYILKVKVVLPADIITGEDVKTVSVQAVNDAKELTYTEDLDVTETLSLEVAAGQYGITVNGVVTPAIRVSGSATSDVFADTEVSIQLSSVTKSPLIFKEVYNASTAPFYINDTYFEIVNNSDEVQYLDQVILGSMTQLSAPNAWVDASGSTMDKYPCYGYVVAFPGSGKDHPLQPGESVVVANDAMNHSVGNSSRPDLSNAKWEVYRANATMFIDVDYDADNMDIIYCNATSMKGFGLGMSGFGLLMAKLPEGVTPQSFAAEESNLMTVPNTTGTLKYLMVPSKYLLDAVEVFDKTASVTYHTFLSKDDAGYAIAESYSGKCERRKVIEIKNGRAVYQDTNNSSNDFLSEQPLTPGVHPSVID